MCFRSRPREGSSLRRGFLFAPTVPHGENCPSDKSSALRALPFGFALAPLLEPTRQNAPAVDKSPAHKGTPLWTALRVRHLPTAPRHRPYPVDKLPMGELDHRISPPLSFD